MARWPLVTLQRLDNLVRSEQVNQTGDCNHGSYAPLRVSLPKPDDRTSGAGGKRAIIVAPHDEDPRAWLVLVRNEFALEPRKNFVEEGPRCPTRSNAIPALNVL